jgi:hypothetical protein
MCTGFIIITIIGVICSLTTGIYFYFTGHKDESKIMTTLVLFVFCFCIVLFSLCTACKEEDEVLQNCEMYIENNLITIKVIDSKDNDENISITNPIDISLIKSGNFKIIKHAVKNHWDTELCAFTKYKIRKLNPEL